MRVPGWIAAPLGENADLAAGSADGATGVDGNTRLTAATGMVLFVLLAVEGVTLLSVRQLITVHTFVGVLLLGPVLLKSGTTLYRFARYYTGAPAYTAKGPPHPLLRVIGPFVILSSLALLGTGVGLIFLGTNGSGWLLTAHQTCFWVWVALMTVHVLGHLFQAAATSWSEVRASLRGRAARARRWRYAAVVSALVIGVAAATMLLPAAGPWTNRPAGHSSSPGSAQH